MLQRLPSKIGPTTEGDLGGSSAALRRVFHQAKSAKYSSCLPLMGAPLSEEEAHDLATHVLPTSFLVIHDAVSGGPEIVTALCTRHAATWNSSSRFC